MYDDYWKIHGVWVLGGTLVICSFIAAVWHADLKQTEQNIECIRKGGRVAVVPGHATGCEQVCK